jgi:integrase
LREARNFKRSAYAEGTKKTYRSQLKSYFKFCLEYSLCPIPVEQSTLIAYVAHLAGRISPGTIPGYLNVIRLLHMEAGLSNPLDHNWELALVKKGINRLKGKPPIQKLPLTLDILKLIFATLNPKLPADAAFWAAILIGFYGFLRKSTLLPDSQKPTLGKFISREDVLDFSLEHFSIRIRHSKVIQFGQRVLILPYARVPVPSLCPVRALLTHLGCSPLPKSSPLFNFRNGPKEISLHHSVFVSRLKSLLTRVGVNPQLYSAHSLRRGGATFAFSAGLSPLQIKLRGDWASSAFERYVHISPDDALAASKLMSSAVLR